MPLPSYTFWHYTNQIIIIIINIDHFTLHPSFPFLHKPPLSEGIENVQTNLTSKMSTSTNLWSTCKTVNYSWGHRPQRVSAPPPRGDAPRFEQTHVRIAVLWNGDANMRLLKSNKCIF